MGFCRWVCVGNHRDQWLECRLAALTLKEKLNNIGYVHAGSCNKASTLAAGAYQYALYFDGRMIDSKQMITSK